MYKHALHTLRKRGCGSFITRVYSILCIPECGNAIHDAYRECQVFDSLTPGTEEFNVALCGKQESGTSCYLLYADGLDLIRTEANCYNNYVNTGSCTCRSALTAGVAEQGCCLDAYHDLVEELPNAYNPDSLYDACNVDAPEGCNNSPLTLSSATKPVFATITTLIFVFISGVVA